MTAGAWEVVGGDDQLFPRTIGEVMALMVRSRWPRDTAKHVMRAWDLDPKTARNLTQGHASERTITKALKAEGWSLLTALGQAVTGQSYAEWEEARLNEIINEASRAQQGIERLRARRERLEAIAAELVDLEPGMAPASRRRA
jgi:hypothetical protein